MADEDHRRHTQFCNNQEISEKNVDNWIPTIVENLYSRRKVLSDFYIFFLAIHGLFSKYLKYLRWIVIARMKTKNNANQRTFFDACINCVQW